MINKEKQLEELNKEIAEFAKNKFWGDIWLGGIFLPTYCYPHKYDAVFVAIQPSDNLLEKPHLKFLGNFNISTTDKNLQNRMVKFGFGGSYVTDIVKLQRPASHCPTTEEIEMFLPFLKKEIRIINPKIVVAMGCATHNILVENKKRLGIKKLFNIFHPAATAAQTNENRDEQFENLKKELHN